MSSETTNADEKALREALDKDPADWESRKKLAHVLYDAGGFEEAARVVWAADEIPGVDLELAFAARVLAKARPRKAIRLLTAVLEHNRGKAVQNLGLANALMHHGMVLQAARFYGAALEADPALGNPDLEHFILWTDDDEGLWGDFKERAPKLGELPWMKRSPEEADKLTKAVSHHTSPVKVPGLKPSANEELQLELYEQKAEKGAEPSPPPAVTIPVDRVDPKHRRIDPERGAVPAPEKKPEESSSAEGKSESPAPAPAKPSVPTAAEKEQEKAQEKAAEAPAKPASPPAPSAVKPPSAAPKPPEAAPTPPDAAGAPRSPQPLKAPAMPTARPTEPPPSMAPAKPQPVPVAKSVEDEQPEAAGEAGKPAAPKLVPTKPGEPKSSKLLVPKKSEPLADGGKIKIRFDKKE